MLYKPTTNVIYLQDSSSHSESETSGKEFSPCSSKRIYASNQTVFVQFSRKIFQSKNLTQVADREGLSTNRYFSVVASMIDASAGNRDDFVPLPNTGRRARSCNRKAKSSQINQNFVPLQYLVVHWNVKV